MNHKYWWVWKFEDNPYPFGRDDTDGEILRVESEESE